MDRGILARQEGPLLIARPGRDKDLKNFRSGSAFGRKTCQDWLE